MAEIELTPAGSWDIAGLRLRILQAGFIVLDLQAPSRAALREFILRRRFYIFVMRLSRKGLGPPRRLLAIARATGRLAANLELRLGDETGSRKSGMCSPSPLDGGDRRAKTTR